MIDSESRESSLLLNIFRTSCMVMGVTPMTLSWILQVSRCSCVQVHAEDSGPDKPLMECDPIQLAIFSHRSALRCQPVW